MMRRLVERRLPVRPVRLGSVERDEREERVRPVRLGSVEREEREERVRLVRLGRERRERREVGGPETTSVGEGEIEREEREYVAGCERNKPLVFILFRCDNDRRRSI
jgi:hypothetical protein